MDDALLDVVMPVVEGRRLDGFYVTRHWKQGQHWRLHVDVDRITADSLTRALSGAMGLFVSSRPRATPGDPEAYLAVQERRAELENEEGPFLPLLPAGSVDEVDEPDRSVQLGGAGGVSQLAAFYEATNGSALQVIRSVRAGANRQALALDLMIATAHVLSAIGLPRGFVSFRSHADAFLSWWPEAVGSRKVWDERSSRHGDDIQHRIRGLVDKLDSRQTLPPHIEQWLNEAEPVFARAGRDLAEGRFSVDPPWAAASRAGDARADLAISPFHSRASAAKGQVDKVWFAQYRLSLNYLYLHLTRIGLTPYDRFFLCHLIADAAENLFGVAAHQVQFPQEGEEVRVPDSIESRHRERTA